MDKIIVDCPKCQKKYTLPAEKIASSKQIKLVCKNCSTSFLYPSTTPISQQQDEFVNDDITIISKVFSADGDTASYVFPRGCEISLTYSENNTQIKKKIDKRIVIVGRTDGEIILNDPLMSRKHFSIEVKSSTMVELKDLASRNGTFHNNIKVSSIYLQSGDIIKAGSTQFIFSNVFKV